MKRKYKILRNAIQCKNCGEIIESKSIHDFVGCKCFKESGGMRGCAVDGGHGYLRRIGSPDIWVDLSDTRPYTDEERDKYNKKQIEICAEFGWEPNLME